METCSLIRLCTHSISSKFGLKFSAKSSFFRNVFSDLFHAAQLERVIIITFQKITKNASNEFVCGVNAPITFTLV